MALLITDNIVGQPFESLVDQVIPFNLRTQSDYSAVLSACDTEQRVIIFRINRIVSLYYSAIRKNIVAEEARAAMLSFMLKFCSNRNSAANIWLLDSNVIPDGTYSNKHDLYLTTAEKNEFDGYFSRDVGVMDTINYIINETPLDQTNFETITGLTLATSVLVSLAV